MRCHSDRTRFVFDCQTAKWSSHDVNDDSCTVLKALCLIKDFLIPIFTFVARLFGGLLPHVQKPLTDYRKTLNDISALIIRNHLLMYGIGLTEPVIDEWKKNNAELQKCYDALRDQHARLLSSSSTYPSICTPHPAKTWLVAISSTNWRRCSNA